jgi:undecaprenyl-diphosphatase
MSTSVAAGRSQNYFVQLFALVRLSFAQLFLSPSNARRVQAARRLGWHVLLVGAVGSAMVVVLMLAFDATEIGLMPPRGSPGLWPARILTDFGKDANIMWFLLGTLVVIALLVPLLQQPSRARLLRFGTHVQYVFCAVLFSNLVAELLKYAVGRARPFVGGKANAFNFAPFAGSEAFFSFPSAHAVTVFALAFAVGAIWPRTRVAMYTYALMIAATRLVLLAHHPSDVVAGALIGILGALVLRYWFAARRLGFAIRADGEIVPL